MESRPSPRRGTGRVAGQLLRPLALPTGPTACWSCSSSGRWCHAGDQPPVRGRSAARTASRSTTSRDALTDPLYREVALDHLPDRHDRDARPARDRRSRSPTCSRSRPASGELPLLLFLVLADELNPMVRIYAWRMLLGREGLINEGLQWIGIINQPIDALLFSKFAVIVVLSTSYLTYTVIPIYGAMKAIDSNLFEAALDLGAGWWTTHPPRAAAADRAGHLRRPAARLHPAASPTSRARPWSAAPAATCSARSSTTSCSRAAT